MTTKALHCYNESEIELFHMKIYYFQWLIVDRLPKTRLMFL